MTPIDVEHTLSKQDKMHLQRLNEKLQVMRDTVRAVASGLQYGCFLTGRGGIGKSWTVVDELERSGRPYQLWNSHMTPLAVYECLANSPESVHVFEDCEDILRNTTTLGVLRSALAGSRQGRDGRPERLITWSASGRNRQFVFTGGVIIISNRPLNSLPEVQAFATRVPCLDLPASNQEIAAKMREIALGGKRINDRELGPEECLEVADFLIDLARKQNRQLELRMFDIGLAYYLQADDNQAGCDWRDLVASAFGGRPSVIKEVKTVGIRDLKHHEELEIAREIMKLPRKERARVWKERTGMGERTLYRRMEELGKADWLELST